MTASLVQQSTDRVVTKVGAGPHTDIVTLMPRGESFRRGNAAPVTLPMTTPANVEPGCLHPKFQGN